MTVETYVTAEHGRNPISVARTMLWQAVLVTQVSDLFNIRVWGHSNGGQITLKSNDCVDAENWVGKFPSQNFILVCTFAGFDPQAIHERLIRIMALPAAERAQISFGALSQNPGKLWDKIEALEAALANTGWENDNG